MLPSRPGLSNPISLEHRARLLRVLQQFSVLLTAVVFLARDGGRDCVGWRRRWRFGQGGMLLRGQIAPASGAITFTRIGMKA